MLEIVSSRVQAIFHDRMQDGMKVIKPSLLKARMSESMKAVMQEGQHDGKPEFIHECLLESSFTGKMLLSSA